MKLYYIIPLLLMISISYVSSLELKDPVLRGTIDQEEERVFLTGHNSKIVVFNMVNREFEKIIDVSNYFTEKIYSLKIVAYYDKSDTALLQISTDIEFIYCLFDMKNPGISVYLPKEISDITSAAFSEDGSQLALGTGAYEDMQIARWDSVSGDTDFIKISDNFEIPRQRNYYNSVGFLDDNILYTVNQGIRELYSWPHLDLLQILDGDTNPYEMILNNRTILVPKDGDRPVYKITLPDKIPFTETNKEDIYSYWAITDYLETMYYSFPMNSLGLHAYWSQIFSDGKIIVITRPGDWAVMDYEKGDLLGFHKMERNSTWMTQVNFKKAELLHIEELALYIYNLYSGELVWSYSW
jgi:hypothetical protein